MPSNRNLLPPLLIALLLMVCPALLDSQIGYQSEADANVRDTVLLRDFKPTSMLHTKEHVVLRAKFPVIDVHQHVNDAMVIDKQRIAPPQLVSLMDRGNIKMMVILTGLWGERLQQVLDQMVKPYPDRFMVFTQLDWSKINDPQFSQEMVAQLDDAVQRGARGLKILKDLGLGVRDKSGRLIAVDDPLLDPVWEECGRLGIPVAIHVTDPEAFFHPVDASNERYEELIRHPDWSFYDQDFPSKEAILAARNRIFARHPHTTFIALHMANWPENLDDVGATLDRYQNVYVEFGAREAELGRQPRRAREFFMAYSDRIMFGSDNVPEEGMYRNYFRWLETGDEYFEYWGYPEQGFWRIYGLELPDDVLRKIYHLNAEKIFAQFPGTNQAYKVRPSLRYRSEAKSHIDDALRHTGAGTHP